MRKSLSSMSYLLCALLLFALTGCGANSLTSDNNAQPSTVTAKIVLAKQLGKQVGAVTVDTGVKTRLTVTGATIPTAKETFDGTAGGSIKVYPGDNLIVTAEILDSTGAVVLEGYFANVSVATGATKPVSIEVAYPVVKADNVTCLACHAGTKDVTGQNLVANYKQSAHYSNDLVYSAAQLADLANKGVTGATQPGCAGCHGNQHDVGNPSAAGRCFACHSGTTATLPVIHAGNAVQITTTNCTTCHQPHNTKQFFGGRCIACHSVGQDATAKGNYVDDNSGVRAITTEFSKWSHHVTGVALNDAHCAACHLEGTVVNDGNGNVDVVIDTAKHMSDNKTHLRNADTDADFAWDPAAPNHSGMDNFCMSCHDSNGATSPMSSQIQALINAKGIAAQGKVASASNPFGDTISNQYDKMQRPAVVDANSQFNTSNNSHHAVKGKKYSGRSRVSKGGTINDAAFTARSSATMPGKRNTIYDAGKFVADYATLADADGETGVSGTLSGRNGGTAVGDDSTLHCGDCHTVGQYRAADVGSRYNKAVIGAHGSNNEYLLRNNAGTDARHNGATAANQDGTKPYLVCFNCHALASYGGFSGGAHIGESSNNCNSYQHTFGNYTATGTARLNSRSTTGALARSGIGYGNIFGIQCAACHNSGLDNGYGGIHGSKVQTYTDGMGNTSKHFRFMPGVNNVMFVPGTKGGFTGGTQAVYKAYSGNRNGTGNNKTTGQTYTLLPVRNTPYVSGQKAGSYSYTTGGVSNDLNWEQWKNQSIAGQTDPVAGAMGCYTLTANPATPAVNYLQTAGYPADDIRYVVTAGATDVDGTLTYGNWGGCTDHKTDQGRSADSPTRNVLRPVTY